MMGAADKSVYPEIGSTCHERGGMTQPSTAKPLVLFLATVALGCSNGAAASHGSTGGGQGTSSGGSVGGTSAAGGNAGAGTRAGGATGGGGSRSSGGMVGSGEPRRTALVRPRSLAAAEKHRPWAERPRAGGPAAQAAASRARAGPRAQAAARWHLAAATRATARPPGPAHARRRQRPLALPGRGRRAVRRMLPAVRA